MSYDLQWLVLNVQLLRLNIYSAVLKQKKSYLFFFGEGEGKMFDVLWEYDLKETESKQKVWSGRDFFSKRFFLSWCVANQMASEPLCDQHWGQS